MIPAEAVEHHHEAWQIREFKGGWYCAACGKTLEAILSE